MSCMYCVALGKSTASLLSALTMVYDVNALFVSKCDKESDKGSVGVWNSGIHSEKKLSSH
ncbi:hypothetical protein T05_6917 [Trichinella murrelli]|uniref:Uncharacterized protein n=1 Tax=Trichinella murrelli TaxID=144512 RepID=A0A0V0UBY2_9BILA|nr:hypothetical protein T05_6917 [Trichinella murrelli]